MTVVMAVDKRCAASGRALQAESAASEHTFKILISQKPHKVETLNFRQ